MESKIEKKEDINESKLLILYDELQFSYDTAKQKLESIFKAIESNNNKNDKNSKNFYFNEKNSTIKLENKYYICDIIFEIYSFNNIDKLDLSVYEGILLFFEETSIKNKIFADKSHHFDEKYNFSTCIIIFEEEQEDLQNLELFDDFIGQTIDKHFEVIYDCQNLKNFNTDDGIGAFNLSLHSTQWKASKDNKEEKKDIKEKKDEKTEKKEEKMEKKEGNKFYKELNDTEEIEKIFGKIKEIKELNKDPKISMEERRNNAEKAIMMLADMFHLDDDDGEEKEDDEEKK